MDHVDWLCEARAREVAEALGRQVAEGGRVIWRSAALAPPYAKFIEQAGFEVGVGWMWVGGFEGRAAGALGGASSNGTLRGWARPGGSRVLLLVLVVMVKREKRRKWLVKVAQQRPEDVQGMELPAC